MRIDPASRIQGEIRVPGDKSISHRYAILGAAAEGSTLISDYSSCADCHSTLKCVSELGAMVDQNDKGVQIQSPGWQNLHSPRQSLDAGNSGTTIRLLSGLLAGCGFDSAIHGDHSLNRRPMKRIIDPLTQMGARIDSSYQGTPPLEIRGTPLKGIHYRLPVASAQVKSCVLLAGITAEGKTVVTEDLPSRDHTERALPEFQIPFNKSGEQLMVQGPCQPRNTEVSVPGDFSSAIFFIVATLLLPGSSLVIRDVGINPTRTGLLKLLMDSGAKIRLLNRREISSEPRCDIEVAHSAEFLDSFPGEIERKWVPIVIDEFPIIAVLGTQLSNGLLVRGAQELRRKESDRIHSIVLNLRNLGLEVKEFDDGFRILSGSVIQGGPIQTFNDHRIAMSFAIAGILSCDGVHLDEPDCADISFPGFFETLRTVTS